MPSIPVKLVTSTNAVLHQLRESTNALHEEIRQKAYDLFLQNGCQEGRDVEDWLASERELLRFPPSELAETKDEIRIQAALRGFDVGALQVDVLPHSITVEVLPESGANRLFHQFSLPTCIDPDSTAATVDKGMLRIVAKKAAIASSPIIAEGNITKTVTA